MGAWKRDDTIGPEPSALLATPLAQMLSGADPYHDPRRQSEQRNRSGMWAPASSRAELEAAAMDEAAVLGRLGAAVFGLEGLYARRLLLHEASQDAGFASLLRGASPADLRHAAIFVRLTAERCPRHRAALGTALRKAALEPSGDGLWEHLGHLAAAEVARAVRDGYRATRPGAATMCDADIARFPAIGFVEWLSTL